MRYEKTMGSVHPVHLCADALAIALTVGLPLFMPNGYVELVTEKFRLLLACLVTASAALCVALAVGRHRRWERRPFQAVWLWPVGLCLCYTVAWLFAEDRHTALWGLSQRKNGLVLYLACAAVYSIIVLLASRDLAYAVEGALLATGCAVTALSWLNDWMLDPLDAYYTFLPDTGDRFLGTIGNINFFGAFLCLCVPVAVWGYLYQTGKGTAWRYAAALLLCSGLIAAGSDGAWLGCVVSVFLICSGRRTTTRTLARLFSLAAGVAGWALVTGLLTNIRPLRSELRTISAILCMPVVAVVLVVACGATAWILHRMAPHPAYLAVRGCFAVSIAAGVGAVLAANLLPQCPNLLSALHFDERWGANRGYVWRRLWVVYTEDTTLFQKLFGLGGDAVSQRLNPDLESTSYMILLNGEAFDSAHNEFLQHLVCGGACGLVCWCGFLGTSIWRGLKKNPALAAALTGYAVQSFFSISMPGVLPLVFVLAAVAEDSEKQPKNNYIENAGAGFLLLFLAALELTFWI